MARSESLEAILRAQYELDYAEPEDWARCLERLNALLDEAIAGKSLTRHELLSVLRDRYKDTRAPGCWRQPGGGRCERGIAAVIRTGEELIPTPHPPTVGFPHGLTVAGFPGCRLAGCPG